MAVEDCVFKNSQQLPKSCSEANNQFRNENEIILQLNQISFHKHRLWQTEGTCKCRRCLYDVQTPLCSKIQYIANIRRGKGDC